MVTSLYLLHVSQTTAAALAVAALSVAASAQQAVPKDQERRPKVVLRAQPQIAVAPSRIVLTAELTGGANDFEEYYCPTIEWDWGDDTRSESTIDCDPYEAGKSQIKRRFTVEHVFRRPGAFKLFIRLKRGEKVVGVASTTVQIRSGGPF